MVNNKERKLFKFDYRSETINTLHYGTPKPPAYDPKLIKADVTLITGTRDALADPKDTKLLYEDLVNAKNPKIFILEDWDHITYLFGTSKKELFDIIDKQLNID